MLGLGTYSKNKVNQWTLYEWLKLLRLKTSVPQWESVKMLLGGEDAQKSTSPTPSSHRVEASDMGDAVQDLMDDVDSL